MYYRSSSIYTLPASSVETWKCYEKGFICDFIFLALKYSTISALVILDNLSLNFSLC
jgi:hypothetical protein